MILGLLAGGVLASGRANWAKIRWLAATGAICLAAGWLCGALGICPVVKRIWTPSWVLYSGGWCFLLLAGFYAVMDIWRLAPLGISARSHWDELDRGLYDRSSFSGIHSRRAASALRIGHL